MAMHMQAQRRLFGVGMFAATVAGAAWFVSPGIPVWIGPRASAADKLAGQELFEHQWTAHDPLAKGDGLGPVFNARSCAACHFQGGVGGGGSAKHNAVGYEALARPSNPEFTAGTIHAFSTTPDAKESLDALRKLHPIIKRSTLPAAPTTRVNADGHCVYVPPPPPDFDPLHTESVNSTALFGAGWIDLISDKAVRRIAAERSVRGTIKELNLDFSDTVGGKVRVLADGRVGKFGWKAQFATLEEFVAAACANELGLGTPKSEQAKPFTAKGTAPVEPDLDRRQFRALVGFVKTLPCPVEAAPASAGDQALAAQGKELFASVGCAQCHVENLGGVKGVYTDLMLHVLDDPRPGNSGDDGYGGSDPLPQFPRPGDLPEPQEWKTPALWGVADSAPYFHDGATPTLEAAVERHKGEANSVMKGYAKLTPTERSAVIAFLKTLKAPPEAIPLRDPKVTILAAK